MKPAESYETLPEIKERLDWIVNQVSRDDIPLEEALSLYEEAVKLGARVSTLIEDAQGEDEETAAPEGEDTSETSSAEE